MKRLLIILAILMLPVSVFGADVNFAWTPVDCDDCAGYTIYWGVTPGGPYTESCTTTDATASSATCSIEGTEEGVTLYFTIRSVDKVGNVGGGNEVAVPFEDTTPCPDITDFRRVE